MISRLVKEASPMMARVDYDATPSLLRVISGPPRKSGLFSALDPRPIGWCLKLQLLRHTVIGYWISRKLLHSSPHYVPYYSSTFEAVVCDQANMEGLYTIPRSHAARSICARRNDELDISWQNRDHVSPQ